MRIRNSTKTTNMRGISIQHLQCWPAEWPVKCAPDPPEKQRFLIIKKTYLDRIFLLPTIYIAPATIYEERSVAPESFCSCKQRM